MNFWLADRNLVFETWARAEFFPLFDFRSSDVIYFSNANSYQFKIMYTKQGGYKA